MAKEFLISRLTQGLANGQLVEDILAETAHLSSSRTPHIPFLQLTISYKTYVQTTFAIESGRLITSHGLKAGIVSHGSYLLYLVTTLWLYRDILKEDFAFFSAQREAWNKWLGSVFHLLQQKQFLWKTTLWEIPSSAEPHRSSATFQEKLSWAMNSGSTWLSKWSLRWKDSCHPHPPYVLTTQDLLHRKQSLHTQSTANTHPVPGGVRRKAFHTFRERGLKKQKQTKNNALSELMNQKRIVQETACAWIANVTLATLRTMAKALAMQPCWLAFIITVITSCKYQNPSLRPKNKLSDGLPSSSFFPQKIIYTTKLDFFFDLITSFPSSNHLRDFYLRQRKRIDHIPQLRSSLHAVHSGTNRGSIASKSSVDMHNHKFQARPTCWDNLFVCPVKMCLCLTSPPEGTFWLV